MRTTLAHGVSSTELVLVVQAGPLVKGMTLTLDAEACQVFEAITPTQARVLRGQEGSMAAAHLQGASVWCEGPVQPVAQRSEPVPSVRATICPTCGRAV